MFSNAKKVAVVSPAKGKVAARVVEEFPGLSEVAALDACAKAIKGLLDLKKAALKESVTTCVVKNGLAKHSRPDVMALIEGSATGKASVVKRATTSPLSSDELEVLAEIIGAERDEEGNITSVPGFAETRESHPAMLAVNPAYANDEALLKRIDKALSGVKGIPEDFIEWRVAESKIVVSDTATDAVFRLEPEVAEQVFSVIAGVTIGTVFGDVSEAWEIVRPMLAPNAEEAKASVKKMLRASLKA